MTQLDLCNRVKALLSNPLYKSQNKDLIHFPGSNIKSLYSENGKIMFKLHGSSYELLSYHVGKRKTMSYSIDTFSIEEHKEHILKHINIAINNIQNGWNHYNNIYVIQKNNKTDRFILLVEIPILGIIKNDSSTYIANSYDIFISNNVLNILFNYEPIYKFKKKIYIFNTHGGIQPSDYDKCVECNSKTYLEHIIENVSSCVDVPNLRHCGVIKLGSELFWSPLRFATASVTFDKIKAEFPQYNYSKEKNELCDKIQNAPTKYK